MVLPAKSAPASADDLDILLDGKREYGAREKKLLRENKNLLVQLPVKQFIHRIWKGEEKLSEEEELSGLPFEELVDKLSSIYFSGRKESSPVGMKCRNCEFRIAESERLPGQKCGFNECWEGEFDPDSDRHVFDLIGHGTHSLIWQNVYLQSDVPVDPVSVNKKIDKTNGKISVQHRRNIQISRASDGDHPDEVIKEPLVGEIESWDFPLHFIDFEAGNFAVPIRKGRNPYHLVVFQYSCHTLYKSGKLVHHDWIHDPGNRYSNYELIRSLMDVPAIDEGTLIHYSGFEKQALGKIRNELAGEIRDPVNADVLIEWIDDRVSSREKKDGLIGPGMTDLSRLVKNFYYNAKMGDSLGLKELLPAVMEQSSILKERFSSPYESSNFDPVIWYRSSGNGVVNPYSLIPELPGADIRQGADAMTGYSRLRSGKLGKNERAKLVHGLKQYCELDTLAIVMVYMRWKEYVDKVK